MNTLAALSFILAIIQLTSAQNCAWNRNVDFPTLPPLLLDKASWVSLKSVLTNGNPIVSQTEGASIVVACTGYKIGSLNVEVAEGVCSAGKILIGSQLYTIMQLNCTGAVKDSALDYQGSCGNNGIGTLSYMGFKVGTYPFYPVIKTCFETTGDLALYSQHTIYGKSVTASEGNPVKPSFRSDVMYPMSPANCYTTANQDAYVTQVTGDANYIDLSSGKYFAKGHMAASADLLLDMESDASFYYINVHPQWQLYNDGNWKYIETGCRNLAAAHQVNLQITTGPLGKLQLANVNGSSQDFYICDDQSTHIIPVALSAWKVVYDPVLDQGVAIITSNVPYQSVAPTPVCPTVDCMTITWLSAVTAFAPTSFAKGYTYCCNVQDFHVANPHSPNLPTAGLLLN